jgi:hypothetical protein|tara:strand:+ start:376 stop:561 length:186 start_codon:yes stop_codon:yes gene_type:complete
LKTKPKNTAGFGWCRRRAAHGKDAPIEAMRDEGSEGDVKSQPKLEKRYTTYVRLYRFIDVL